MAASFSSSSDEATMVEKLSIDVSNKLKVEELKEEFRSYDVDQDGFITVEEIRNILTKDGDKVTDEEIFAMIRAADVDGDGRISYDEFVKLVTKDDDWETFFKVADEDKDGFLTERELRRWLELNGTKLTEEGVCAIIKSADVNGDGRISYDEFGKFCSKLT